jgi:hypothetical protein
MRTEGGNEDRRGQERDVFAAQNTPRRLYKGAPGVRASDFVQTYRSLITDQTLILTR